MHDFEPKRGRPREQDRQTALDRAIDLVRKGGFASTSMEEILSTMRLSRSSFYKEFGSKDALLFAALERYSHDGLAQLRAMAASKAPGRLRTIVYELAKFDDPKGCMVVNAMVELADSRDEIADLLRSHNEAVADTLAPLLRGDRDRANAILAASYGAVVLQKVGTPRDVIEGVLEQVIRHPDDCPEHPER